MPNATKTRPTTKTEPRLAKVLAAYDCEPDALLTQAGGNNGLLFSAAATGDAKGVPVPVLAELPPGPQAKRMREAAKVPADFVCQRFGMTGAQLRMWEDDDHRPVDEALQGNEYGFGVLALRRLYGLIEAWVQDEYERIEATIATNGDGPHAEFVAAEIRQELGLEPKSATPLFRDRYAEFVGV